MRVTVSPLENPYSGEQTLNYMILMILIPAMKSARRYLTKRVSYGCVVNSVNSVLKIGLGLETIIIGFLSILFMLGMLSFFS